MSSMTREEWLALRKLGVTGSEISRLMGKDLERSIESLLKAKMNEGAQWEGNAATRLGQLLEPYIAEQWATEHKKELTKGEFTVHPTIPWAIGTPDFLYEEGGLEVKTGVESTWTKGAPKKYIHQCTWYALIVPRKEWHLTGLVVPEDKNTCPVEGDDPDYIKEWCSQRPRLDFEVEIDPDLQERMLERAEIFLERLRLLKSQEPNLGSWPRVPGYVL